MMTGGQVTAQQFNKQQEASAVRRHPQNQAVHSYFCSSFGRTGTWSRIPVPLRIPAESKWKRCLIILFFYRLEAQFLLGTGMGSSLILRDPAYLHVVQEQQVHSSVPAIFYPALLAVQHCACKQQIIMHNDSTFLLLHDKLPSHTFDHLKRLLLPNRMCHLHPSCRCLGVGLMLLDAFWEIFHEHITGAHATPSAAPSLQFNPSSFPPSHCKIYETCQVMLE